MVSGVADFVAVAGVILVATLLSHRLWRRAFLYRDGINRYARLFVVTLGSTLTGVAVGLYVISGFA